jgi:hypothetical protein
MDEHFEAGFGIQQSGGFCLVKDSNFKVWCVLNQSNILYQHPFMLAQRTVSAVIVQRSERSALSDAEHLLAH